jgi:hypothetical protein
LVAGPGECISVPLLLRRLLLLLLLLLMRAGVAK